MDGKLRADSPALLCSSPPPDVCPISKGPCTGECIYASVMESQQLGVVVLDLRARAVLFVNRSARDLLQRLGKQTTYSALIELLLGGVDRVDDLPPVRAAEPLQIGSRLLGYTVYRERSYVWVFLRDITEKVRLESIAEAVEVMNGIGYVFAAVRHELGNPVNSVKAALSVLRSSLDSFPRATVAEYLDRMASELGRVEALLRSLKSFSMYEAPEVQPIELGQYLGNFRALVADEVARRGVSFEVAARSPCWALGDPRALQQVLLNLFANAADALEGSPGADIRIGAQASDGIVTVSVADNGPGMTREEQQDLFMPFHTTKKHGTGLGLVVSRKMLAKMNGTIAIESERGVGTIAILTLPEGPPR